MKKSTKENIWCAFVLIVIGTVLIVNGSISYNRGYDSGYDKATLDFAKMLVKEKK